MMFCLPTTDNEINKETYIVKKNHYMKDLKNYRSLTLTTNFKNQIEKVVEVDEEKSPLNSWFRQQGCNSLNTNSIPKVCKTALPTLNRKLPRLTKSDNSQHKKSSKKEEQKNSLSSGNANHSENIFNSISLDTFSVEKEKSLRTPQPLNSFYMKCIEDVIKSNQPQKLVFKTEPTELVFVNSEPFFTYITFGTGKNIKNIWKIDRKSTLNAKGSNTESQ